jgi:hypothetical protein
MNATVRSHHTSTVDRPWDGPATETRLPNDADARTLRRVFAWTDPDNPGSETAAKFPHHEVSSSGRVGAANVRACINGISILNGGRGGAAIPKKDRSGVYRHLAMHLKDAGREPAALDR